MELATALENALHGAKPFTAIAELLARGEDAVLATPGLVRPLVTAAVFHEKPRPTLVVVSGQEAAERYARQLTAYVPRELVLHFPTRGDMPWSDAAPDVAVVGARSRAIDALQRGREVIVVAAARTLLRALPPQGSHVFEPLALSAGAELDLEETVERLSRMGYERTDAADERGRFAVRGGVLDVFASDATGPVRAEFFGDEIETLRRYVPTTGQSIGESEPLDIYPCRELSLGVRPAQNARRALAAKAQADTVIAHHLEMIEQGVYFNGIERYLPLFYRKPGSLIDYLAPNTLVVVTEPRSLFDDMVRGREAIDAAAQQAEAATDGLFLLPAAVDLGGRQRLTLLSMLRAGGSVDAELLARRPEVAGGEDRFLAGLRGLLSIDYGVALAVPDRSRRERVADTLVQAGISVEDAFDEDPDATKLRPGVVHFVRSDVPAGFVIPDARVAVVSIDDAYPRSSVRRAREIEATQVTFSFKPGDYVVHSTHGVGLFRDMVRKELLGGARDYLQLEYAKGDKLYVPVDQIDRVTKYVGPDGSAPRVTRLNTADWSKATGKARKAARKLAFDLVDLYSRRSTAIGFAYGADTTWQMEMEAMFPFEETPDQLTAIADTKLDMESEKPMDRLICGDVGYGKTEVAMRAVFKAVQGGKQVMVLCPTTILAQQHFTNFSERFAPFSAKVEVLSRFRNKEQQKAALEGFADGNVDVLIGTHRLLSSDVTPKDLGLIVVDEEQRFGVQHKEHLTNLREQVDVLTLTATPIPRTLQMSLSGVRDMSVIDTPPPNRFPVKVHVGEYDADVVSGAIRREIERGGQVYFVSNRVKSIDEAVARVREAAPEARIAVAHGQMSERELERVMEAFSANEVDVLVATTIVESGIDNPHSNTLIIEDSQRLGLAQLYQLKGRVGRSHVRAFAFFMFPRGQSLTEQAVERLTAIGENTELGSGIKVAMRDLEIRGAGSLLGAEQHGQMSAVGFDLYSQMLREAVAEARGEPPIAHADIKVSLPAKTFLPEEYVPEVNQRVLFYRRIAGAPTIEAIEHVDAELRERFGPMPEPARDLIAVARIRAMAADAGLTDVSVVRRRVMVGPISPNDGQRSGAAKIGAIYLERERKFALAADAGGSALETAKSLLDAILTATERV